MRPELVTDEGLSSSIGHHGAYIWETKRVFETYIETEDYSAVKEAVLRDNLLRKSSDKYRQSIISEIARRYDLNKQSYTETPLLRVFNRPVGESIREWILYYEFSQEPLVTLFTAEFLYPFFHSGVLTLKKEDAVGFIQDTESDYSSISSWSENTKAKVAEHYLAAMKNFGLLEGDAEKKFKYVYPPNELILYVLYSLFEQDMNTADAIFEHPDWKLLLLAPEDVRERVQGVSPSHVQYERRGSVERLESKYESLMGCVDEF